MAFGEQPDGDRRRAGRRHVACLGRAVDQRGEIVIGTAKPLGDLPGDEAPAAGADHRRVGRERLARKKRAGGFLDLGKLAIGEIPREIGEGAQPRLVRVTPQHAGKPCRARFDALARQIGGRVGVGIVGAVVGGYLFSALGSTGITGFNIWSMLVAIIGAVIVLWLYHMITARG